MKNFFVYTKTYDVIEEKVAVISSRLRERNKKSTEYYAGDYYNALDPQATTSARLSHKLFDTLYVGISVFIQVMFIFF